ncbi:MAG TPA: hypothetical protein VFG55_05960 [Rhodanobacteraceae bacterium]|nr:hypothetical protein [Rhodanobacteraceae bacterium]
MTLVLVVAVLYGFATPQRHFDEITVHRINVVEPDGTLRMVISDHADLPGIIVHGKQKNSPARPQAGMLFYNDEGSEIGGLIFAGHKNAKGEIVDSGGSLSFDQYGASQIVQLAGVDDKTDKFSGLSVAGYAGGQRSQRVWVGRDGKGDATVALMDAKGRKRILLDVTAEGAASISFLDANGKVTGRFPEKSPPVQRH